MTSEERLLRAAMVRSRSAKRPPDCTVAGRRVTVRVAGKWNSGLLLYRVACVAVPGIVWIGPISKTSEALAYLTHHLSGA